MFKLLSALLFTALCLTGPAQAQDRQRLGMARLFTNDFIGDGKDRWRSGSYFVSQLRGPEWTGALPTSPGEIIELRFRTEIIAPTSLLRNAPRDRRYAGVLGFGLSTHFAIGLLDANLGAEVVATGKQTLVGDFQREIHGVLGLDRPRVLDQQIGNALHAALQAEVGRDFHFGERFTLRPFVQAQWGVESLVRVGGDMVIGHFGQGDLLVRDDVTGQRVEGISGPDVKGFSVVMGGDIARVFDSIYLPDGGNVQLSDTRSRLRAGVNWQGKRSEAFYGVTLLGREFDEQPQDQLVGSLRLRLRF